MYTSLDPSRAEIRLLSVIPCLEYDAKVSCEITVARLQNSPPQYAALSYVWGDASITEDILVNGQPFQATKSLASALRQFRESYVGKHGAPSFLWADAVCINQQDLVERAQQVSMMGSIYSKADWVISWLGPFDGSIEFSFSLIKACAGHVEAIAKKTGQYPEANVVFMDSELEFLGQNRGFYEHNTERFARNEAWNAVDKLSAHVYWTRIWIVQEVVLAQRPAAIVIHCGKESMTFQQLSDFNLFTERFLEQKPAKPSFFDQRVWDWVVHDSELSMAFIRLIHGLRESVLKDDYRIVPFISSTCRSTDPRDAVFGLSGLIGGEIVPDYTKEVAEVYKDLIAAVLRHRKYKNFFCFAGLIHEGQNISVFPSWVPRFHSLKDNGNYAVLPPPPNADAKSWLDEMHLDGPIIIDGRRMQFSGLRLDHCTRVIRYIGDQQPDPNELMKKFWWTCLEFLKMWDNEHPRNGSRPLENLLRALSRGKDTQSQRLQITPSLQCMTAHAFRILLRAGEPEDDAAFREKCGSFGYTTLEEVRAALDDAFVGTGAPEISTLYEVLTPAEYDDACNGFNQIIRLLYKWIGWPLFITSNGRMGLAPPAVAESDMVCLLEGFSVPCLLREMDRDFVLVGSCYVNGYSDGEPLQSLKEGNLKLEVFRIQ